MVEASKRKQINHKLAAHAKAEAEFHQLQQAAPPVPGLPVLKKCSTVSVFSVSVKLLLKKTELKL